MPDSTFQSMRRGVDYIGVGSAIIIASQPIVPGATIRFLATMRGPEAQSERGTWVFPGGSVRFGELRRDAIAREVREELGVEVEVTETLETIDHIIASEAQHWVSTTFIGKIIRGTPRILEPRKCLDIAWLTVTELVHLPLSPAARQNVAALRERYPFLT